MNMSDGLRAGNTLNINTYMVTFPIYLAGMQSWFYSVFNGVNTTISQQYANNSWSISVEFLLYIFFVPLALYGRFKHQSLIKGICILTSAIIMRFVYVKLANNPAIIYSINNILGESQSLSPTGWMEHYSPYGRFFEFLAGVGIAEIWLSKLNNYSQLYLSVISNIFGVLAIIYIIGSMFNNVFYECPLLYNCYHLQIGYAISAPLAVYTICHNNRFYAKFSVYDPFMFMDEISYSLYMIHGNLFPLFKVTPSSDMSAQIPDMATKSIAFFCILIILSWISYNLVEMPARRWIDKIYKCSIIKV
jgi:peptidoglycan/LPS O-acetylase OafA/YrhL